MATETHGKDGSVKVGGSAVAFVDAWTAKVEYAKDDVTAMDSGGWQKLIPGIKKASGNIKLRLANDDTGGQTTLKSNVLGGSAVVLTLNTNGTANPLSGTALLDLDLNAPHGAPNEVTYNFESSGPWTYT